MPTKKLKESGTENKRRYSTKEIMETLSVFKKCDLNYQRTINVTGVCRNTLKKWVKQHPEALKDNRTDTTIRKVEAIVSQKEESLLKKYYNNQEDILDICYKRLKEILPSCKHPLVLLEVIKVFNPKDADNNKSSNIVEGSIVSETIQRLSIACKKINSVD